MLIKMKLVVLASGSKGNCFYLEDEKDAILIDAGISAKRVNERLGLLGKDIGKIKSIFITHEHSDHIKGADVLARQLNIPIYATKKTIESGLLCKKSELIQTMKNNETINFKGFDVEAFPKSHRAADPVAFNIINKKKISIITDAGFACNNVIKNISDSDFLCLESNHDLKMLENGPYPYFLKQWIRSDVGHLSNNQASLCVLKHANPKLKNIVLSHLSETNNNPEQAFKTFIEITKERKDLKAKISVSTRDCSEVFSI